MQEQIQSSSYMMQCFHCTHTCTLLSISSSPKPKPFQLQLQCKNLSWSQILGGVGWVRRKCPNPWSSPKLSFSTSQDSKCVDLQAQDPCCYLEWPPSSPHTARTGLMNSASILQIRSSIPTSCTTHSKIWSGAKGLYWEMVSPSLRSQP